MLRCYGVTVFRCSGVPVFLVLVHAGRNCNATPGWLGLPSLALGGKMREPVNEVSKVSGYKRFREDGHCCSFAWI